jgi:biotin-dependent carboxylase-like uncharacterized protein
VQLSEQPSVQPSASRRAAAVATTGDGASARTGDAIVTFEVVKPGALAAIQDLGRYGFQRYGVLVGGAMDEWSHRLANALLGNDENDATLEVVLAGPTLLLHRSIRVATCGADLAPKVSGLTGTEPLPHGRPVWLREGARIEFGSPRSGLHGYLAVCGGFAVPPVMGSRSTYLRGGFGGLGGRALATGDRLDAAPHKVRRPTAPPPTPADFARSRSGALVVPPSPIVVAPVVTAEVETVRVVAGAQQPLFSDRARERLFGSEYRIGLQSDRMGYRLEGPTLERTERTEMISEAVTFGTIQVPPDGLPIVLMADRQTAGGYPKFGEVASADLKVLAQMAPHRRLRFAPIALADAQRILLAREREYSHVRSMMSDSAGRRRP